MDHFCIITNTEKQENIQLTKQITEYLAGAGKECVLLENAPYEVNGIRHYTDAKKIPENAQCVIVLGGDGTMIQAAIDLVHKDVPILGVNTGTLGFLSEVECQNIQEVLDKLIHGEYSVERRIMLKESLKFPGRDSQSSCYALNDMVITKRGGCRLITVNVYINGEIVDVYRADGLIISTPTGSTGYNLSAGGPVLVPNLHAMVITPICAHSLNKRSLVVNGSDEIILEIGQTKESMPDLAMLTADGRIVGDIETGDKLRIHLPNATTEIVKISGQSFYERMREKLNGN